MRHRGTGDGDVCPLNPEHGQMFFLQGASRVQWCPDQSHEGVWANGIRTPPTRAYWPQGHESFRRAVIAATLPEIDISLIGGCNVR